MTVTIGSCKRAWPGFVWPAVMFVSMTWLLPVSVYVSAAVFVSSTGARTAVADAGNSAAVVAGAVAGVVFEDVCAGM